jgi:transposase
LTDKEYILQLESAMAAQNQQIKILEEKVLLLLCQLQSQSIKKDSHNSSLPPSSDIVSKPKNLRVASNRKSGGQPGHTGTTLEMSTTPHTIIDLKSAFCSKCGQNLKDSIFTLKATRQVVEILSIKPAYEEYRQYSCQCPRCQNLQVSDFPVNAPIQYGSSVESLVSYFSVYHGAARAVYTIQTTTKYIFTSVLYTFFGRKCRQYFGTFCSKMRGCLSNY